MPFAVAANAKGPARSEYGGMPIETLDDYAGIVGRGGAELTLHATHNSPEERHRRDVRQRLSESRLQIHNSDGRGPPPLHDPGSK